MSLFSKFRYFLFKDTQGRLVNCVWSSQQCSFSLPIWFNHTSYQISSNVSSQHSLSLKIVLYSYTSSSYHCHMLEIILSKTLPSRFNDDFWSTYYADYLRSGYFLFRFDSCYHEWYFLNIGCLDSKSFIINVLFGIIMKL